MNWWLILKYQERVCELYESLEIILLSHVAERH